MSLSYVKHRIALERRIVGLIVTDALAQGYQVEANNGGDDPIISTNAKAIMSEAMATDEASLAFWAGDRCVGSVLLVYGNDGFDVIADRHVNSEMDAICARAEAYAETAESEERV